MIVLSAFFFFFKQKTAYEMRISDWSSDVCSSDLLDRGDADPARGAKDEQGVAFLDMAAIDQRVDAGAIGHQQRRALGKIMGLGQMIDIVHRYRDRFGDRKSVV